jgi:hypothetical protein
MARDPFASMCVRAAVLLFISGQAVETAPPSIEVRFIAQGRVWRRSETTNVRGLFTPPFKDALITMVGFPMEPAIGERVTVIPDNGVAAFDLRVESIEKLDTPEWGIQWLVNLELVKAGPLLSARPRADRHEDYPIGAIVVYPAVEGARGIAPGLLDPASIPPTTRLDLVHMAADLDGDGAVDAVVVEFCCKNPAKDAKNGCADYDDYVCGATYLKSGDLWKTVSERTGH